MTPDEIGYTEYNIIDRYDSGRLGFNSSNESIALRYVVGSFYYRWLNGRGGRVLIFIVNMAIVILVIAMYWQKVRYDTLVNQTVFVALVLLLPTTLFFTLAALRDIYIFVASLYLLGISKETRLQAGTVIPLILLFILSPFVGIAYALAAYLSSDKRAYSKASILMYYLLIIILIVIPTLSDGRISIIPLKTYISVFGKLEISNGVLDFRNDYTALQKISANYILAFMPFLNPANIVGKLDVLFFLQSIFILSIILVTIKRSKFMLEVFTYDKRMRFAFYCIAITYPIFFKERDASSMIRHSMVLLPHLLYISLITRKRYLQSRYG
jgi:hypothetical protein